MTDELRKIPTVQGRTCGECRLCCKLLAVGKDEDPPGTFKKEQGKWCEHCFDGGCRIYDTKPEACEDYSCAWLRGLLEDGDRPDKAKIVVSLEGSVTDKLTDRDGNEMLAGSPVWCVYETTPGIALRNKKARRIIEELMNILVRLDDGSEDHEGPFPICIIPNATGLRRIRVPGIRSAVDGGGWVPCLRPDEKEEDFGLA